MVETTAVVSNEKNKPVDLCRYIERTIELLNYAKQSNAPEEEIKYCKRLVERSIDFREPNKGYYPSAYNERKIKVAETELRNSV